MSEQQADDEVRAQVREHYGAVARAGTTRGCGPGCCVPADARGDASGSERLGYRVDELGALPDGADLGLGCGNPTAIASLREGQTVLDLGAGGGLDCFLAARQVGPRGKVIGVDMTPDMVALARANARKANVTNVEFRLGEIERLPVPNGTVDVVISNCVINLSPDKRAAFAEAFRVLKPGGRLAIADVVATAPIPVDLRTQSAALTGCIAGAAPIEDVRAMLADAGFADVDVTIAPRSAEIVGNWSAGIERVVASATIEARKPVAANRCCGPECCA